MKDQVWFNGEIGLFVSSPNNSPVHLPYTSIKRMTWTDTQHVSVVLEGILPAAKALLWIGQGGQDVLEVVWSDFGPYDIYSKSLVAMRLIDCRTKYKRIKDLPRNGREEYPITIEVRLACQLEVVGELNGQYDNAD